MTIALLSHPYHRGGVTQWMANSFNALSRSGEEPYFISVTPEYAFISSAGRPLITSLLDHRYDSRVATTPVGYSFELGNNEYRAARYCDMMLKCLMPGTALIPSDDEACWMAAAAGADKYPMVAILHADEEKYFQLASAYGKYVSVFICVSHRIRSKLLKRHPELSVNSMVLPCGIDVGYFSSGEPKQSKISWIGRVGQYQKRAQDIIPIFQKVMKKRPGARLEVLGGGDYSGTLAAEILRHDLDHYVVTPGWVSLDEIKKSLASSQVFLQTSDFEGTSVAMMEALASGCGVVCSRVSGAEDLENLEEGNGVVYLFEPGDRDKAARLIETVLTQWDSSSAAKAVTLAARYFDIDINNRILIDFIDRICSQDKSQGLRGRYRLSSCLIFFSNLLALLRWSKWQFFRREN